MYYCFVYIKSITIFAYRITTTKNNPMKNPFTLIRLAVALTLMLAMLSCTTAAKHHKRGLVAHGCRGIKALPNRR